jgi:putative transposase
MGLKNPIQSEEIYFLTMTIVDWVDVFTRPAYKHLMVQSLEYCQNNKGLELYSWCLMTNHLHLIAGAAENYHLSNILRDFKKYTSKGIIDLIREELESRKEWMLDRFEFAGKNNSKIRDYKVWQDGNEPKAIHTNDFMDQKLNYTHKNPVRAEIVDEPHHYRYSSAINYAGGLGLLDVILVS